MPWSAAHAHLLFSKAQELVFGAVPFLKSLNSRASLEGDPPK